MTLQADLCAVRGAFDLRVTLAVPPGEVLGVLGPNGSGKSTLLRCLAGLTPLAHGTVTVGGRAWEDTGARVRLPARERSVGLVFQDYRLFPHLSVRENTAFAPRARGLSRAASRTVADRWLQRLDLSALADRRPGQLSGGQAQRVALARALAADPQLLLLDEPLAALDAATRLAVRTQLRDHLAAVEVPVLVVTHDPLEALVMTDRLLVLEGGRVVQAGRPQQVAQRPATPYVARLVGLNLWSGQLDRDGVVALAGGGRLTTVPGGVPGPVLVALRPSAVVVSLAAPGPASPRSTWPGTVTGMELLTDRVRLQVHGSPATLVDVTPATVAELGLRPGTAVWLSAKATEVDAYPA